MSLVNNLIYHYCSTEIFLKILEKKTLHLTDREYLNDMSEADIINFFFDNPNNTINRFDLLQLKCKFQTSVNLPDVETIYDVIKSKVYVTCFSEKADLLSQWRGYADDGKGIAIGFDKSELGIQEITPNNPPKEKDGSDSIGLIKIEYLDEYKFFNTLKKTFEDTEISNEKRAEDLLKLSYRMKFECFKEEDEWRIIYTPNLQDYEVQHGINKTIEFKAGPEGDSIKPYFTYPFQKQSIKKVVLGPKNYTRQDDLKYFFRSCGLNPEEIDVENSQIPYR